MAREINTTQPYSDKLIKLIPTEIVGAYMVLAGFLDFTPATSQIITSPEVNALQRIPDSELKVLLIQIIFFVLLLLTPLYLWKVSGVSNILQLTITALSFVIWVYTLGGPFVVWGIYL